MSGGTVSLPAYPSVPSLSGYVNTVNVTGSGNVITDISKSGSTITVTKGNFSGGSSGGSVDYVYRSTLPNGEEEPILQLADSNYHDYYVEILRNAMGNSHCGGEVRLKSFDAYSDIRYLQICALGIRSNDRQIFSFGSQGVGLCIDSLSFGTGADDQVLMFDVARAKQYGILR